ncbi:MAG: glutamate formiminotransferase, partial [Candidatus Margulisbacteria bacterium]|nr:glutamate formiminotransferase [Candidatus Margulisiibacteriota bacterium]
MAEIIECVPNVSEGRNYRTIEKLSNTIRAVEKVQLLDVHRDIDHNRSVFTFIGTPVGVFEAAYNMTEQALELIDINKNDGVHPFIGAV